jgi:hypothetical protein
MVDRADPSADIDPWASVNFGVNAGGDAGLADPKAKISAVHEAIGLAAWRRMQDEDFFEPMRLVLSRVPVVMHTSKARFGTGFGDTNEEANHKNINNILSTIARAKAYASIPEEAEVYDESDDDDSGTGQQAEHPPIMIGLSKKEFLTLARQVLRNENEKERDSRKAMLKLRNDASNQRKEDARKVRIAFRKARVRNEILRRQEESKIKWTESNRAAAKLKRMLVIQKEQKAAERRRDEARQRRERERLALKEQKEKAKQKILAQQRLEARKKRNMGILGAGEQLNDVQLEKIWRRKNRAAGPKKIKEINARLAAPKFKGKIWVERRDEYLKDSTKLLQSRHGNLFFKKTVKSVVPKSDVPDVSTSSTTGLRPEGNPSTVDPTTRNGGVDAPLAEGSNAKIAGEIDPKGFETRHSPYAEGLSRNDVEDVLALERAFHEQIKRDRGTHHRGSKIRTRQRDKGKNKLLAAPLSHYHSSPNHNDNPAFTVVWAPSDWREREIGRLERSQALVEGALQEVEREPLDNKITRRNHVEKKHDLKREAINQDTRDKHFRGPTAAELERWRDAERGEALSERRILRRKLLRQLLSQPEITSASTHLRKKAVVKVSQSHATGRKPSCDVGTFAKWEEELNRTARRLLVASKASNIKMRRNTKRKISSSSRFRRGLSSPIQQPARRAEKKALRALIESSQVQDRSTMRRLEKDEKRRIKPSKKRVVKKRFKKRVPAKEKKLASWEIWRDSVSVSKSAPLPTSNWIA